MTQYMDSPRGRCQPGLYGVSVNFVVQFLSRSTGLAFYLECRMQAISPKQFGGYVYCVSYVCVVGFLWAVPPYYCVYKAAAAPYVVQYLFPSQNLPAERIKF